MGTSGGEARCEQAVQDEQDVASTLVLRLSYDGTDYAGFAAQSGQPHVRTVAGELQRCMTMLLRAPVVLTCAGRTDAGVHARAQYVSLPLSAELAARMEGGGADRLARSLTAVLPDSMAVRGIYRASPGFSARFDAQARRYRYRIACDSARPLFCARWAWWLRRPQGSLDVDAMREAAQALLGEHDFKSFCKSQSAQDGPTSRNIASIELFWEEQLGERLLAIDVVGNAFLHNMVRIIVGSLAEVGLGRREPSWMARVLQACDRRAAGPTAPPTGLTFWEVRYPEGSLRSW